MGLSKRAVSLTGLIVFTAASLAGCQPLGLSAFDMPSLDVGSLDWLSRADNDSDDDFGDDAFETKVETPLVGKFVNAAGLNPVSLHGVGLITGLDGTGSGNPRPSPMRSALLEEMRKRGVQNPNQLHL